MTGHSSVCCFSKYSGPNNPTPHPPHVPLESLKVGFEGQKLNKKSNNEKDRSSAIIYE